MREFLVALYPAWFAIGCLAAVGLTARYFSKRVRRALLRGLHRVRYPGVDGFRCAVRDAERLWFGFLAAVLVLCVGSALFTGSAVFGLAALVFGPWYLFRGLTFFRARRLARIEDQALGFFYGLQGLIQTGMGLPATLFHLSRATSDPDTARFAQLLHWQLLKFDEGRPLADCLGKLRTKNDWQKVRTLLVVIEVAYRRGLPVSALLGRLLPEMEIRQQSLVRMRDQRRAALSQCGIAFGLVWGLETVLFAFQPDLVVDFLNAPWALPLGLALLTYELFGAWLIGRAAAFY